MSNIIIEEDLLDLDATDLFEISTRNPTVADQVQELSSLWNGDITMTEEGLLDDPELDNALATARFNRTLLKDDPQETAALPRSGVDLRSRLRANGDVHAQVVPPSTPPALYVETVVTPRWSPSLRDRLDGITGIVDLKGKDIFDGDLDKPSTGGLANITPRGPRLSLVQGAEGWETPVDFTADDITF